MRSNATPPRLPLHIRGLHQAYAMGLDPVRVVEGVLGALERADDPGIFITLVDRKALRRAVHKLGRFDPTARPLWGIPCRHPRPCQLRPRRVRWSSRSWVHISPA